jgi:pimeloyl-ACP methyl ester carboxylesterase
MNTPSPTTRVGRLRRSSAFRVLATLVAIALAAAGAGAWSALSAPIGASAVSTPGQARSTPERPGSAANSPGLPASFTKTFKDKFVNANGIRQHIVTGGDGPPLLLVHGWPENWYAWRYVMPELAKKYTVIAVDQRGIGLTERARTGYDTANLARDLAALMTKLGHRRFAVVGHDTGMVISYALAADFRDRVARLAVAEVPGPPTLKGSPPAFIDDAHNEKLWHISFNRVNDPLILDMVGSNADAYYRYEYRIQGGGTTPPEKAIKYYIGLYTENRTALRASFGFYRAWDSTTTQNGARQATPLTIPVLGIGGVNSWGPAVGGAMNGFATNVQTAVIQGAGHWVAEQAPTNLLATLLPFLEPYRNGA